MYSRGPASQQSPVLFHILKKLWNHTLAVIQQTGFERNQVQEKYI